jgi:hypothetical protein
MYQFDNIYEKRVYDSWKKAISNMDNYYYRKLYYPKELYILDENKLYMQKEKEKILNMYKAKKHLFNSRRDLNTYLPSEINSWSMIKEIEESLRKIVKSKDNFLSCVQDTIKLEHILFEKLLTCFENAYLQKQAQETMQAAESLLKLRNTIPKEKKNVVVTKLRRSKRLQHKPNKSPNY